jgi:hypothetical protein
MELQSIFFAENNFVWNFSKKTLRKISQKITFRGNFDTQTLTPGHLVSINGLQVFVKIR